MTIILIKFSISGLAGVITNFSLCAILKEYFKINKYFSNSFALANALILNFFLNRIWTFEQSNDEILIQMFKYFFVVVVSVVINHLIVHVCNEKFKMNFYLSKIFAVGVLFLWNFSMHYLYTFASN